MCHPFPLHRLDSRVGDGRKRWVMSLSLTARLYPKGESGQVSEGIGMNLRLERELVARP